MYIYSRAQWRPCGSYLLAPLIQLICIILATYVALTRISDNKHYASDVIAGTALGVLIACAMVCLFVLHATHDFVFIGSAVSKDVYLSIHIRTSSSIGVKREQCGLLMQRICTWKHRKLNDKRIKMDIVFLHSILSLHFVFNNINEKALYQGKSTTIKRGTVLLVIFTNNFIQTDSHNSVML
jgi:hypothetical protein